MTTLQLIYCALIGGIGSVVVATLIDWILSRWKSK